MLKRYAFTFDQGKGGIIRDYTRGQVVRLTSLDLELSMDEVYYDIEFEEPLEES
ncbi:hypothetical protein KSC_012560 [Ktedonobacter sp. SOSP1-52]|nr:hypothetical protein KSC_012560 [Ktedonobacter sp. SOSP1-52]